mmetsp:Transcript_11520/g.18713  ORF Transcript_11520/g.18713 Transcript_11520/m.18713 type:complete len:103 (-) Transcript_11520:36-344(-)
MHNNVPNFPAGRSRKHMPNNETSAASPSSSLEKKKWSSSTVLESVAISIALSPVNVYQHREIQSWTTSLMGSQWINQLKWKIYEKSDKKQYFSAAKMKQTDG